MRDLGIPYSVMQLRIVNEPLRFDTFEVGAFIGVRLKCELNFEMSWTIYGDEIGMKFRSYKAEKVHKFEFKATNAFLHFPPLTQPNGICTTESQGISISPQPEHVVNEML